MFGRIKLQEVPANSVQCIESSVLFISLQTLYDPTYIAVYNVIYTSLPVVALAILDQVRMLLDRLSCTL